MGVNECMCTVCCSGGGLFIMLCMSPPAKPLLSQQGATAALLRYQSPIGTAMGYSAPQAFWSSNRNTDHHKHLTQLHAGAPAEQHTKT